MLRDELHVHSFLNSMICTKKNAASKVCSEKNYFGRSLSTRFVALSVESCEFLKILRSAVLSIEGTVPKHNFCINNTHTHTAKL